MLRLLLIFALLGTCAAVSLAEETALKDDEILKLVYDKGYRVPKGFFADPALKDQNRSLYFHQDNWFADDKAKAKRIVTDFLRLAAGVKDKEIVEENETKYSFDFRAGFIVYRIHKTNPFAWKGGRVADIAYEFPKDPIEIGKFKPKEVTKDAVRAFAEYEWNIQNYNMGGAKVLRSETKEEDGKVIHRLITTSVVYGDFGLQDEITVGELTYTVNPKDGTTVKSAKVVKELKGKRN